MLVTGRCRLCLDPAAALRASHVLPAFAYRWIKRTSATGRLRMIGQPNRPLQDGIRHPLLCAGCEQRIGRWETRFAKRLFLRLASDTPGPLRYGRYALPFAVSLAWRCWEFSAATGRLGHLPARLLDAGRRSAEAWRRFLLAGEWSPEVDRVHLLRAGFLRTVPRESSPPNLNRFLARATGLDVAHGGDVAYVFAKLPAAIFIGFLSPAGDADLTGTRIRRQGGRTCLRMGIPALVWDYIEGIAAAMEESRRRISTRQREAIDRRCRQDLDRVTRSATFAALDADVAMFGEERVFGGGAAQHGNPSPPRPGEDEE